MRTRLSALVARVGVVVFAGTLISGITGLNACSNHDSASDASRVAGDATLDPVPGDTTTLAAQLKRYKGQTSFVNPVSSWYDAVYPHSLAAKTERPVQEADIFKVGKPGSRLLYLLNQYRGLQVVSYADGPDSPRLLGRAEATGNWPEDMYYQPERDRVLVIERKYFDDEGDYTGWTEMQSRLIVYDVSTPDRPVISQTVEIRGEFTESRLVGDILYVATAVRPAYEQRLQGKKGEGYVLAYRLGSEVSLAGEHQLQLPVGNERNMSVVQTAEGGTERYYLISVLSESGWGWWDQQSSVEVVDISSTEGRIEPLMVVAARGVVTERTQTNIKDRTLLVTSNFTVADGPDGRPIARVAVEAWKLPEASAVVIDRDEAEYRRLHIERSLKIKREALIAGGLGGAALETALEQYRSALVADTELGLSGRFIREAGTLRKPVADGAVTVGSTQGMSARLQDVRYRDDKLYVFWVPANNIDPLDIFDLSKADQPRHVTRLEFDGWIQRAEPMSFGGRDFILGLGWIVPSVDNDTMRRYPQAALFEVKAAAAGGVRAELVSQISLGSSDTWANFNAEDKYIEFRETAPGKGVIMFAFMSWDSGHYMNGGKLIGYDLTRADTSPDTALSEGGVLTGAEGWLRRLFSNHEIDRINAFSDLALGTYRLNGDIGAADAMINAAHVLELARNIRAYVPLGKDFGVQIIGDGYWSYAEAAMTELRLVQNKRADSEAHAALGTATVPGDYLDHVAVRGDLYILTQSMIRQQIGQSAEEGGYQYLRRLTVSRFAARDGRLVATGSASWETDRDASLPNLRFEPAFLEISGGIYVAADRIFKVDSTLDVVSVAAVQLAGCDLERVEDASVSSVSGQLMIQYGEPVKADEYPGLALVRRWLVPVTLTAEATLDCGQPVNIPGEAVAVISGHLVTRDTRLIDLVPSGEGDGLYYRAVTGTAMASARTEAGLVRLASLYDPDDVGFDSMRQLPDGRLAFVESTAFTWYPWLRGGAFFPRPATSQYEHRLAALGVDPDGVFTKTEWVVELAGSRAATLADVVVDRGGLIGVVTLGRTVQVIGFDAETRPRVLKLAPVNPDFTQGKATDRVMLKGWWYGGATQDGLAWDDSGRSLIFAEGYYGATQINLLE